MKKINIENFMAVKTAQVEIHKTTLIVGDNGQGKSSCLVGLAACVSGDATPIEGITKASAIQLVNDSAREGSVKISEGEDYRVMAWPDCTVKEKGLSIKASATSLGFNPLTIKNKADRAKFFSEFLGIEPTQKELREEVNELIEGKASVFKTIWSVIETNGWDKASSLYADKSKESQGAFKSITGSPGWGESKGAKWLPSHWSPDLESTSKEALEKAKVRANDEVEACLAAEAVSDEKIKDLEILAEQLTQTTALRDRNNRLIERAEKEIEKLGPRPEAIRAEDPGKPCPQCGTHLVSNGGEFQTAKASAYSQEEVDQRIQEIADYDDKLANIKHHKANAERENIEYSGMIKRSTEAEVKLAEIMESKQEARGLKTNEDQARENLRIASANLESFIQKERAEKAHLSAVYYRRLSEILAPGGLRKKVLSSKIEELNAEIAKVFPEFPLTFNNDLVAKWEGRILALSCESARWRAGVVFRAIISKRSKDELFLVDGLDILSNANANILIKRLRKIPANSIITSTVKRPSEIQKLPAKMGKAYYIADGHLMEVE